MNALALSPREITLHTAAYKVLKKAHKKTHNLLQVPTGANGVNGMQQVQSLHKITLPVIEW